MNRPLPSIHAMSLPISALRELTSIASSTAATSAMRPVLAHAQHNDRGGDAAHARSFAGAYSMLRNFNGTPASIQRKPLRQEKSNRIRNLVIRGDISIWDLFIMNLVTRAKVQKPYGSEHPLEAGWELIGHF